MMNQLRPGLLAATTRLSIATALLMALGQPVLARTNLHGKEAEAYCARNGIGNIGLGTAFCYGFNGEPNGAAPFCWRLGAAASEDFGRECTDGWEARQEINRNKAITAKAARAGAAAAVRSAPTNAARAPGNARTATASPSAPPSAGAMPQVAAVAPTQPAGVVVDGAAFRCGDGSLLHVTSCQGNANDATCKLTELHLPGLQMGKQARRADIAARVNGCEAGGIRYGADDKPVFVR
ncbi:MAG: hypothetical protein ACXW16_00715 [Burkholderiaceae bacterium]